MLIDFPVKLSRSSKNAFSASMIMIVVLATYNWIYAPCGAYLSAAQQYNSVIDSVVNKNKAIESRVKVKKKKLKKFLEESSQLQSTLFTPEKAREFFSDLQAISEQAGCVVYSVNMVARKSDVKDAKLDIASGIETKSALLSVVGVYRNIIKLIERLQSRTQKVWIESIKLRTLNNNSDQARCDITIAICALTDKEPEL